MRLQPPSHAVAAPSARGCSLRHLRLQVSELREELAARGLESTGLKKDLVERLQKALGA